MKLLKHQEYVVNNKSSNIICNWARNAGKTFTIAKIIEKHKPQNVLYLCPKYYNVDQLKNNLNSNYTTNIHTDINDKNINIFFDYVFFDEILPYNVGIKCKQSISFVTYNNSNKWLERFFPYCEIYTVDYTEIVKENLLTQKHIDMTLATNAKRFKNEYGLLS